VLTCINKRSLCFHIELNMMVHNVVLQLPRVLNKVLVSRKIKSVIMVSVFICVILTTVLLVLLCTCYVVRAH